MFSVLFNLCRVYAEFMPVGLQIRKALSNSVLQADRPVTASVGKSSWPKNRTLRFAHAERVIMVRSWKQPGISGSSFTSHHSRAQRW